MYYVQCHTSIIHSPVRIPVSIVRTSDGVGESTDWVNRTQMTLVIHKTRRNTFNIAVFSELADDSTAESSLEHGVDREVCLPA